MRKINHKLNQNSAGYSVLELLIAIAIFSLIMLIAAVSILYLGRMYYKGGIISRTQETSRMVMDNVVQAVQFDSRSVAVVKRTNSYCVGNTRYTFDNTLAFKNSSNFILWRDKVSGTEATVCNPQTVFVPGEGEELLSNNMILSKFDIIDNFGTVDIVIEVAYGDSLDLFTNLTAFNSPTATNGCVSVDIGGQFCAVSGSQTTVLKRLK